MRNELTRSPFPAQDAPLRGRPDLILWNEQHEPLFGMERLSVAGNEENVLRLFGFRFPGRSLLSPGTNFVASQDTARMAVCACPNSPDLVQLAEKVFTCTFGQVGQSATLKGWRYI